MPAKPMARKAAIVVDNLSSQKGPRVRALIEDRGGGREPDVPAALLA